MPNSSLNTIGGLRQDTFLISTLSNAIILGGDDADSVSITGSLMGATVDFGAGNENFTLSVGSSNSTIAGGDGNDTFIVTNQSTTTSIDGGSGNDSVSVGVVQSGGTISGAAGQDTLNFSLGVNNGAVVSGDAGSDLLLFSSTVSAAQVFGGDGGDSMILKDVVSNSTIDFGAVATHSPFLLRQLAQRFWVVLVVTSSSQLVQTLLPALFLAEQMMTPWSSLRS